jgi:hypothetical protein
MSIDEVPPPGEPVEADRLAGWRLIESFARFIVSSTGNTLRLIAIITVPSIALIVVIVALAEVINNPLWLLGALPSGLVVAAFIKVLRLIRLYRGRNGPNRY